LPECLDDFIDESNPVRVIDVFVDALDLAEMSFEGWNRRRLVGHRTIPRSPQALHLQVLNRVLMASARLLPAVSCSLQLSSTKLAAANALVFKVSASV
jgi:hypothetical protein